MDDIEFTVAKHHDRRSRSVNTVQHSSPCRRRWRFDRADIRIRFRVVFGIVGMHRVGVTMYKRRAAELDPQYPGHTFYTDKVGNILIFPACE
jgi:hypothetical protein